MVGDEVGLCDGYNIVKLLEGEVVVHVAGEEVTVFWGGVMIEVEGIAIAGMVEGGEGAKEGSNLAGGAEDEVGEARRESGGGGVGSGEKIAWTR